MNTPILCLVALLSAGPARAQVAVAPPAGAAAEAETLPLALGAKTAEGFDDPAHVHFFRYQLFLRKTGLAGLDSQGWAKLAADERAAALKEGESRLAGLFAKLLAGGVTGEQMILVQAVWGPEVATGLAKVDLARQLDDPAQLEKALEGLKGLTAKVGGKAVDWDQLFDGFLHRVETPAPAGDFTAPDKKEEAFLDRLQSPGVAKVLSRREYYQDFLTQREVPPPAVPAMLALYDVLSKAKGEEKTQTAHILPTVVQFLRDGKKVELMDLDGAYGVAVPGEYDRPEKVGVALTIKDADPLIAADTLSHEFQHIYDMYAGRYYTLDSELRGFKMDVMFHRVLKSASPEKYAQLSNSNNDETRRAMMSNAGMIKAYEEGAMAFQQHIAYGHGYNRWEEGTFMGRVTLKEAVDPNIGASRELAALQEVAKRTRKDLAVLEKRQEELRAKHRSGPSRDTERELEKATKDVSDMRGRLDGYDREMTIKEMRLARMMQEAKWAARKSGKDEPYDLNLAVDKEYVTP
ncbi:MAG: hypothetical protein A2V88_06155 [Elusimicrobia bacterium RBG_16_66_12]|nr:MAG: hypothetical protein A2V88_06155 [Elusimicrobia bacterium RBG_16_66_12]